MVHIVRIFKTFFILNTILINAHYNSNQWIYYIHRAAKNTQYTLLSTPCETQGFVAASLACGYNQ